MLLVVAPRFSFMVFAPSVLSCCIPSLGLETKARACKVASQEGSLGVTSHAPNSAKSVRK